MVSDFLLDESSIVTFCKQIASTSLWRIEPKRIYELDTFEASQKRHQTQARAELTRLFDQIKTTLQQMFEIFKGDGKEVYSYWLKYIQKIDNMIEDAARSTLKKSLLEISKAINGESKSHDSEIHPLFKVNFVLEIQKVEFSPSFNRLEEVVNKVARDMITSISVLPRLAQFFAADASKTSVKIYDVIANEDDINKIFVNIQTGMINNSTKCQNYLHNWDPYKEIWEINKDAFIRRYAKLKPALSTFDADINRYNEVANNAQKEETLTNINFVKLDCSPLKNAIVAHCAAWQSKLTTLLNLNASNELNNIYELFAKKGDKLSSPIQGLESLSENIEVLTHLQADSASLMAQFGPINEMYEILEKYEVPVKDDEKERLANLPVAWASFQKLMASADEQLQETKAKFKSDLLQEVEDFAKLVSNLKYEISSKAPFAASVGTDKAVKVINDYKSALTLLSNQERNLKKGLAVFKIDQGSSKDLELIAIDLELLSQIWAVSQEWDSVFSLWRNKSFLSLSHDELDDKTQRFVKKLSKFGKEAQDWDIFIDLKVRVNSIRGTIPILLDLKNESLRDRHWSQIADLAGKPLSSASNNVTLDKILELGLDQHSQTISEISESAKNEVYIEDIVNQIESFWDSQEFELESYKIDRGYYKLHGTSKLYSLVENNQITLSSLKSLPFYPPFAMCIEVLEHKLSNMVDVIESLINVQRAWMYLENIFSGTEDIRKQLPRDSADFDQANIYWSNIVGSMRRYRNVLQFSQIEGLGKSLDEVNNLLQSIKKCLYCYLDTKRNFFPRLYFLSNEELLEMLGNSKDPKLVQVRLQKCFQNIAALELVTAGSESRKHIEAVGFHSADNESVQFLAPIVLDGSVEVWLQALEFMIIKTLRKSVSSCVSNLKKMKREKWIKESTGMLVLLSGLINFTSECTKALQEAEKGEKTAIATLRKLQNLNLRKWSEIAALPMTKLERLKLSNLIVQEVHSRDVADKLYKSNCSSLNSFDWISQLRYYIDKEPDDEEDCIVRHLESRVNYGFEYLGNCDRICVTPSTERCFLTLNSALQNFKVGCVQGPAGVGKTETVKEFGKAFGKIVMVFNCVANNMGCDELSRIFYGLCQSGAWGCFDQFDSFEANILSIAASHIAAISTALSKSSQTILLNDRRLPLSLSTGMFITLKTTEKFRNEISDLKRQLRYATMILPDSVMIIETILVSEGFTNSKAVSKKIDSFCKHSTQVLSYCAFDFGLKSLKNALSLAGALKREEENITDDLAIFSALRAANIQALSNEDRQIFVDVLNDFFQNAEAPIVKLSILPSMVQEEYNYLNLIYSTTIADKLQNLYDLKENHVGVALVGVSGSGKTTALNVLQSLIKKLASSSNVNLSTVKLVSINPKSLEFNELFGAYEEESDFWRDGLFSSILRTESYENNNVEQWICFDGPMEPIWMDNLHSVLDQNRTLGLINGERIRLPDRVKLFFETESMQSVSPSIIGRLGLMNFDHNDIGWKNYLESWIQSQTQKESGEILRRLVEKYIGPVLLFKKGCTEGIVTLDYSSVKTFTNIFSSVATKGAS
jgi:dynein heavy chain